MTFDFIARVAVVTAAFLTGACTHNSFVAGEKLPGTDGAYYALPRVLLPVSLSREKCVLTVTALDPVYAPDPDAQYRLRIDHSIFAQDKLIVETEPTGLLKTINGTSDDQLPEALVSAVQLVGVLVGGPPPARTGTKSENAAAARKCETAKTMATKVMVDPTSVGVTGEEASQLKSLWGITITSAALDSDEPAVDTKPDCTKVVCFRAARPYVVTVVQDQAGFPAEMRRFLVLAPDPKEVLAVRLDRQLFATSDSAFSFSNGMLTSYHTTKYSELVSVLDVPLQVGAAIIDVVNQLTTLRVDHVTAEKEEVDAQTAYLRAQANLITAQQKLLKTQADAAAAQGAKP